MRLQHFAGTLAVALVIGAVDARAQSDAGFPPHDRSSPTESSRYQIVQSEIAGRYTFLLDRFGGAMWVLVLKADSTYGWESLPDPVRRSDEIRTAGRVNYQLFLSGIAARYMFLVNVNDGSTWNLRTNDRGDFHWVFVN